MMMLQQHVSTPRNLTRDASARCLAPAAHGRPSSDGPGRRRALTERLPRRGLATVSSLTARIWWQRWPWRRHLMTATVATRQLLPTPPRPLLGARGPRGPCLGLLWGASAALVRASCAPARALLARWRARLRQVAPMFLPRRSRYVCIG